MRLNRFYLVLITLPLNLWAQTVVYTTDLEGHAAKWKDFIRRSNAFAPVDDGRLVLKPGVQYVYGGDILDREPGHLQILRDHVGLAEHQPDQVTLITGNRDLNKLPFKTLAADTDSVRLHDFLKSIAAPALFENQRREMVSQGQAADDADVRRGLTNLMQPNGLLRDYLIQSQPAKIIGDTLFVHGAWKSDANESVHGEVEHLNRWYKHNIDRWAKWGWFGKIAYGDLMRYQSSRDGVIYADYSDANWNPTLPEESVRKALLDSDIHRVVVGHRSYGETPAILRAGPFEIIFADNSNSSRSGANIVTLTPGETRIQSRLADGTELDFSWKTGDRSEPIGHWTTDGALIVGRTPSGDWVLFKNPGSRHWIVPKDSLRRAGQGFRVDRQAELIEDEKFVSTLALVDDRARVEGLKAWHGADLNLAQVEQLVHRAFSRSNSFEIGQYIRLAGENASAEWMPALAHWRQAWTPTTARWQNYLLTALKESEEKIACGRTLKP